jgi:hypothetical protein
MDRPKDEPGGEGDLYDLKDGLLIPSRREGKGLRIRQLTKRQMARPVYEPLEVIRWRRFRLKVALWCIIMLLLPPAVCSLDSLRYPRAVRGAYLCRPALMARATLSCVFAGGGSSKSAIRSHAWTLGRTHFWVRLLYLPDEPGDQASLRDRVAALVMKRPCNTDEELFWVVVTYDWNDALLYEYATGKLVVSKNGRGLGEIARSILPEREEPSNELAE